MSKRNKQQNMKIAMVLLGISSITTVVCSIFLLLDVEGKPWFVLMPFFPILAIGCLLYIYSSKNGK